MRGKHYGDRLGPGGPIIVVITGAEKASRATFSERAYERVRQLADEYRSRGRIEMAGVAEAPAQTCAATVSDGLETTSGLSRN